MNSIDRDNQRDRDNEREIQWAIEAYHRRDEKAYTHPFCSNWEEMFAKHNLTVLGRKNQRRKPDGITWRSHPEDGYKGLKVYKPAVVQYRADGSGSYKVKQAGFLIPAST